MSKLKSKLLNVLTFGKVKKDAKKAATFTNDNSIKHGSLSGFNLKEFNKALGSNNLIKADATISILKLTLKDIKKVDLDYIKKNVAKGISLNGNQLNIVIGDKAMAIARALK